MTDPLPENGLVCLVTCGDVQQARLICALLQSHDIQTHIQGEHSRALFGIWGVQEMLQVLVPRERLAEAEALLEAAPEAAATVPEPLAEDEPLAEEERSATAPTGDRRARRRRVFAWAVLAFLAAPLFLVTAGAAREARDRPALERWQKHLRQGEQALADERLDDAEASYRQAVAASEALSSGLAERMDAHYALAHLLLARERWAEAEALARSALAHDTGLAGDEGPRVADDLMVIGTALARQLRDVEASPFWTRAAGLYQQKGRYADAAGAHLDLGLQHADLGRPQAAVASLERARGLYRLAFDSDPQELFVTLSVLTVLQEQLGRPEEAVKAARDALRLDPSELEALQGEREELLAAYARALRALGRMEEAAAIEQRLGSSAEPGPAPHTP